MILLLCFNLGRRQIAADTQNEFPFRKKPIDSKLVFLKKIQMSYSITDELIKTEKRNNFHKKTGFVTN